MQYIVVDETFKTVLKNDSRTIRSTTAALLNRTAKYSKEVKSAYELWLANVPITGFTCLKLGRLEMSNSRLVIVSRGVYFQEVTQDPSENQHKQKED